jgi:hypothetical protein
MAGNVIAGTFLTYSAIGNREDLADMIYNIDPVETPFQAAIDKTKATAVLHEWQTQALAAAAQNAQVEGDEAAFVAVTPTVRVQNRCQIARKTVIVSGTQDAVDKAGREGEMAYQMVLKNKELRRDMEFDLCGNQAPVTGNSTTARQLRPLCGWYATNFQRGATGANGTTVLAAVDGTQVPLTEAMIKTAMQQAWTQGGKPTMLMVGPSHKVAVSAFTGNVTRYALPNLGAFNFVAGAFYQHDNTKFCVAQVLGIYDLFGVPTPPGLQPGGYNNNPQVLCNEQTEESKALYGETNYKFTDATTLTVGARVTEDSKDWQGRQQVFVQQLPSPTGAIVPSFTYPSLNGLMSAGNFTAYPFGVVSDSHSWTQPTYRVTLSHQFTPDVFAYLNYSHGFKGGGYNDQVGTGGTPITDAEKQQYTALYTGVSAQAGALRHGISRALLEADPNLRGELKRRGFLTRDPRVKERKKAGLKKARKRPQFSKR